MYRFREKGNKRDVERNRLIRKNRRGVNSYGL